MKIWLTFLAVAAVGLEGCSSGTGRIYAGDAGSTYNSTSNPPQINGTVIYDPTMAAKPRDFGNSGASFSAKVID